MPLGTRASITAEVTDDDGKRSTNVLLDWRHDAEDQLIVLVGRNGTVTANRLGRTAITAGAGGVCARIPVEVSVIPSREEAKRGSGFPKLLLTGRDLDPATGTVREGDPDQPAPLAGAIRLHTQCLVVEPAKSGSSFRIPAARKRLSTLAQLPRREGH
jgi:hypothetical protein